MTICNSKTMLIYTTNVLYDKITLMGPYWYSSIFYNVVVLLTQGKGLNPFLMYSLTHLNTIKGWLTIIPASF